ncbi:WD40-repeat-containing domain protein [Aspergillus varians]
MNQAVDAPIPYYTTNPLWYCMPQSDTSTELRLGAANNMIEMGRDSFRSSYSSTPALLGSEDPSMIKESEDLLSKFMRGLSQEAQDTHPQPQDTQEFSTNSAVETSLPKARIKIPRGNVQLRPQSRSRPQIGSAKVSGDLGPRTKQTVTLPTSRKKPPSPQNMRTTQSPSSDSDIPKPAVIRRSGRSRAGPANYFKKLHLFDSESEEVQKIQEATPETWPQHQCSAIPSPAPSRQIIRQQGALASSLLQHRELGRHSNSRLRAQFTSEYRLSKAWKGASNDVISLAWSPDGTRFAAGATAQCDEHMMAYNRKNNLLLGDLVSNKLHELPDHWIQCPGDRGLASHFINDPRLFMSVTSVQWFGDTLYTASYDHTVKLWDTSQGKTTCYQTLKHDSEVVVMARSKFNQNLLAIGTHTIGYWDIKEAQYTALELPRARSRKDIELVPTSIAWGTNPATKDYLLAGMSEKEDGVAHHGLLAAFCIRESSVMPEYFSPNSQNVFDVAWHPVLPIFATACTAGQQASRGTRSVVNLYEPLKLKSRVMELECPALDMNEVVFCPMNTNYISASCTDGITYVWDMRNCGELVHTLKHGNPLNQLDETIPREQADTGVNLQLWGATYDQFYTGASDGAVKRWNILRAPEDVFVGDVVTLKEGIMCGAFSPDGSNMLIGDVSGGVHLLSNSPFSPDERPTFVFKRSPHTAEQESDPESGVKAARDLISSGQIERHPVFGPGKGPRYKGPFAAWARPIGIQPEQIAATELAYNYRIRQLSGTLKDRGGLDPKVQKEVEGHITLAAMRNQRRGGNKRRNPRPTVIKTESFDKGNFINLCSDEDNDEVSSKRRQPIAEANRSRSVTNNVEVDIIDLTGDSDAEGAASSVTYHRGSPEAEDDSNYLEDDFWWPDNSKIDPNFTEGIGL